MNRRTEVAGLVQPDGSFIVPGNMTGDVLRRLLRDMHNEARGLGVVATRDAQQLLDGLYAAAERHRQQQTGAAADVDHAPNGAGAVLTVREMADRMGCTPRRVRQLLAAGQLAGRKSGGTWIIHTD